MLTGKSLFASACIVVLMVLLINPALFAGDPESAIGPKNPLVLKGGIKQNDGTEKKREVKMHILKKEIDIDRSPILYSEPVAALTFNRDWRVYSGEWRVEGEWLTGRNPGNFPGMVFLKADFPGNVLVEFEARTVVPSTRDINFMWNGSWDDAKNARGLAYVAGLQGWWGNKVGIEKSPEYKLNATTPLFNFEPGRIYRIQGGSIDGHCFIFVDGRLALEVTDPDPIDSSKYAKVGFEAYCSHIQIRNIKIRQIVWQPVKAEYTPEF